MELGPEDVREVSSFSEGVMYRLQWSWDLKMCPYLERCPHFRECLHKHLKYENISLIGTHLQANSIEACT